jgi:nucleotide-binding universal stress UspA family protein
MTMKILVPHDGSKPADSALRQAVTLARMTENRPEIILLNVVQEIPRPPMMTESRVRSRKTGEETSISALWKELHQEMKADAQKMLEAKKQAALTGGVTITTKVLVGYPSEKILEFANDQNVDLIVIGNVGLGGISRLKALGSVSRTVVEKAKRPVMIVH